MYDVNRDSAEFRDYLALYEQGDLLDLGRQADAGLILVEFAQLVGTEALDCRIPRNGGPQPVDQQRVLDDEAGRKALWERLQFALDGEPDPWFEFDKAQVDLRQFSPLQPAKELA